MDDDTDDKDDTKRFAVKYFTSSNLGKISVGYYN